MSNVTAFKPKAADTIQQDNTPFALCDYASLTVHRNEKITNHFFGQDRAFNITFDENTPFPLFFDFSEI